MPSAWKVTLHIDKTKKWITSSEEYLNKVEGKKEYNGVKVYGLDDWKDWEYDLAIMLDQCPCAF